MACNPALDDSFADSPPPNDAPQIVRITIPPQDGLLQSVCALAADIASRSGLTERRVHRIRQSLSEVLARISEQACRAASPQPLIVTVERKIGQYLQVGIEFPKARLPLEDATKRTPLAADSFRPAQFRTDEMDDTLVLEESAAGDASIVFRFSLEQTDAPAAEQPAVVAHRTGKSSLPETMLEMFDLLQLIEQPRELLYLLLEKLQRVVPYDLAMLYLAGCNVIGVNLKGEASLSYLEDLKSRLMDRIVPEPPHPIEPEDLSLDLSHVPGVQLIAPDASEADYREDLTALTIAGEVVGGLALVSQQLAPPETTPEAMGAAKNMIALLLKVARLYRRKQEESAIHLERLDSIMEVGDVFSADMTIDRMLSLLLELTLGISRAEVGAICMLEGSAREPVLVPRIVWGLDRPMLDRLVLSDGRTLTVQVLETGTPLILPNLHRDPVLDLSQLQFYLTSFAAFPLIFKGEKVGVLELANAPESKLTDPADIQAIEIVSYLTAAAIVNARLHQESLAKERMDHELQLAFEIQSSLLPQQMPLIEGATAAGFSFPARAIGGDYYDILDIDPQHVGLFIADVSGKGVPAAMLTMVTRSYLHVRYHNERNPAKLMTYLNELVVEDIADGKFVTAMYAVLNRYTHELTLSNAGHPPALLYRAANRSIEQVDTWGLPLGILAGVEFETTRLQLSPGDVLCLYTDGIPEAQNRFAESFGFKRLEQVLLGCVRGPAEAVANCIWEELQAFVGNTLQHDDLTLTILKLGSGRRS